jgi:hypothetical protein
MLCAAVPLLTGYFSTGSETLVSTALGAESIVSGWRNASHAWICTSSVIYADDDLSYASSCGADIIGHTAVLKPGETVITEQALTLSAFCVSFKVFYVSPFLFTSFVQQRFDIRA